MSETKENLFEALQSEIERVTRKHERWLGMMNEFPEMRNGMTIGATVMKSEIEQAKRALASGDATQMFGPLESLRGYDSED